MKRGVKMVSLINKTNKLEVSDTGEISIVDLSNDVVWHSKNTGWIYCDDNQLSLGIPEVIKNDNNTIDLKFIDRISNAFEIDVSITRSDEKYEIYLTKVTTPNGFEKIEYPSHFLSFMSGEYNSYLVVPNKQGVIIPARLDAGYMRYMHNTWKNISDINQTLSYETAGLNMTWFGAKYNASSLFCYIENADDSALHIVGNTVVDGEGNVIDAHHGQGTGERVCSLSPVWQSSRGELGYKRKLSLEFVSNGYVGMSKKYLEYSKESGKYVSLKDKIIKNPLVEKLIGAPDVKIYIYTNRPNKPYYRSWSEPVLNGYSKIHTTFDQVGEMAEDLKKAGVNEALILLGGWNNAGYDREHVDMWPPAIGAGGEKGLAKLSEKIRSLGFVFALHDNYQDFYPDAPSYDDKYIMKDKDGSLVYGGIWDGGLCRLICSKKAIELIRRNMNLIEKKVDISSYYLDTITSAPLYECFDEDHSLTRTEDKISKAEVLQFLSEERQLIAGGEAGVDWAVKYCPYFEGLPGSSKGYSSGVESASFGIAVPLFNLVYHDSVICYWQHGQPFGREDHSNHVLHDLLSGQPSNYSIVYDQWDDMLPLIKECYMTLGRVHKKTAFHEMTDHAVLSDDFALQRSEFSDGTTVAVNYGITTKKFDNVEVPPKGFVLDIPGEERKIGSYSRKIEWQN
jgi:hypothetical protein